MTEPEPRIGRYAADADFTTLPDPVSVAETITEQPASSQPPSGEGWDGDDGGD